MNKTTNLQRLREARELTHDQLAEETGVSAETIRMAESGEADLSAGDLYDLALFFETGTADLLASEELAVTTQLDYPGNEAYDGLWGHVGILLNGAQHTKWYPVTTAAAEGIRDDLQGHEKGLVVIRTLNNRVLFVNPLLVKRIMLNDEDAGAPPDFEDVARYMSPASYEAIREWYWERTDAGEATYSKKMGKMVEALLKEENLDEEKIEEVMLQTHIYYRDGASESYYADSSHLANIWTLGYNLDIPIIALPEGNALFDCWYSGQAVALIDTPYLELADAHQEKMLGSRSLSRRMAKGAAEKEGGSKGKRKGAGKSAAAGAGGKKKK